MMNINTIRNITIKKLIVQTSPSRTTKNHHDDQQNSLTSHNNNTENLDSTNKNVDHLDKTVDHYNKTVDNLNKTVDNNSISNVDDNNKNVENKQLFNDKEKINEKVMNTTKKRRYVTPSSDESSEVNDNPKDPDWLPEALKKVLVKRRKENLTCQGFFYNYDNTTTSNYKTRHRLHHHIRIAHDLTFPFISHDLTYYFCIFRSVPNATRKRRVVITFSAKSKNLLKQEEKMTLWIRGNTKNRNWKKVTDRFYCPFVGCMATSITIPLLFKHARKSHNSKLGFKGRAARSTGNKICLGNEESARNTLQEGVSILL